MISNLARTVFVALVATLGDYVWFEYRVPHTTLNGITHGAALLVAVGLVLGQQRGEMIRGIVGGAVAGVAGALTFYALSGALGYLGALIAAWIFMWIVLAGVSAWVRGRVAYLGEWIVPGLIAAVGSGAMFYLVSGIWTDPVRGVSRNYLWHLAAWTLAWGPGIVALTWNHERTT
ncbi:MAG TPA: hypothetical protein VMZ90_03555 [Vicinamibacterales bacterium]|nr:hypothetical protein [Vicinamibacterales bacterium]